jgi:hypothetical protein
MILLALLACSGAPATSPDDTLAQLRAHPLVLTRHAQCRMACRDISRDEVTDLLSTGTWMPERTRLDGECPSHAVEGHSADGQHIRAVYAACKDETRLVTAIDLGEDHPCDDCP